MFYFGRMKSKDDGALSVITTADREELLAWAGQYLVPGAQLYLEARPDDTESRDDVPLPVPE